MSKCLFSSTPLTNVHGRWVLSKSRVNRGCLHKWKNLDEMRPGRMVFVLLNVTPYKVNGQAIEEDLGNLAGDYVARHVKH